MADKNKMNLFTMGNILFRVDRLHDTILGSARGIAPENVPIASTDLGEKYEVHFHCKKHERYELSITEEKPLMQWGSSKDVFAKCPLCEKISLDVNSIKELKELALSLFNSELFKDVKLIRTDDFYTPEIKVEMKNDDVKMKTRSSLPDGYKIVADVKKDSDDDTIVMLQFFKDGKNKGAQFFVKPEKRQLTSDHNNPNPADFISEIKVKLNGAEIKQRYESE